MPEVAMRTTVPSKPSSETTRLDPPDRTSSGSSASSTSRTASTSSSVVVTVTSRAAGPPTRIVVREDSGPSCSCVTPARTPVFAAGTGAASVELGDGERPTEDLLAGTRRGELDRREPRLGVERLDDAGHLDVGARLVGHHDHVGEPDAVLHD